MSDARPNLDALFRPRSIAVIGASRRRGSIGGEIFHNLVSRSFPGPVYPVNPGASSVQSVRAYPTLAEVPDPVDLAVIVVPRDRVLAAVDECGKKGIRGIVIISNGFAETGPDGRALQDEIVRRVRAAGMCLVGPNCLGLLSTDPSLEVNATFAPTWPPAGVVAFSSQSGALGLAILDYARELGIGISEFVSVGNKADVSGNDLLEQDVVFRLPPLTDRDAADTVSQIRGARLLDGFRGAPVVDREALVDVLLRVSRMVGDLPEIAEMDVNPLLAFPRGAPPVALDARIRISGSS